MFLQVLLDLMLGCEMRHIGRASIADFAPTALHRCEDEVLDAVLDRFIDQWFRFLDLVLADVGDAEDAVDGFTGCEDRRWGLDGAFHEGDVWLRGEA